MPRPHAQVDSGSRNGGGEIHIRRVVGDGDVVREPGGIEAQLFSGDQKVANLGAVGMGSIGWDGKSEPHPKCFRWSPVRSTIKRRSEKRHVPSTLSKRSSYCPERMVWIGSPGTMPCSTVK